jgi:hypothetical protein
VTEVVLASTFEVKKTITTNTLGMPDPISDIDNGNRKMMSRWNKVPLGPIISGKEYNNYWSNTMT